MRIGLVLPAIPAYSETFFRSKVSGLIANGHEVVIFVNEETTETQYCGARVVCSFSTKGNRMLLLLRAKVTLIVLLVSHTKTVFRFIKRERKDHTSWLKLISRLLMNATVLSERLDWLHFGFGTIALERENVADAMGAKMAVSFRGFDIAIYPLKYPGCYDKVWKKVDKIHVLSDDLTDLIAKLGGEAIRSKCVKITPAIDTTFFSRTKPLQPLQSPLQLLTIARLHWKKGLDYTLEALALLHQKGVAFHYTIIGTGPEEERLRFTAYQLGITPFVTFAGKQAPEYIKKQLEQTDVYVQYSIQEGFGNAVLEAQAMGVHCIVSDAEGLNENVQMGVTGSVLQKRNSKILSEVIEKQLYLAKEVRDLICLKAISRVNKEFFIDGQIKKFLKFYQ